MCSITSMDDQKRDILPFVTRQLHPASIPSSLASPSSDMCDVEKSASAEELLEHVPRYPVEDDRNTPVLFPGQSDDRGAESTPGNPGNPGNPGKPVNGVLSDDTHIINWNFPDTPDKAIN